MRIFLLTSVLLACSSTPLLAAKNYGAAGCGLGSIVVGPKKGFIQILALTTNGTSGNQTFGITTGTSNCLPASASADLKNQQAFVTAHISELSKDMARGEGETLHALSATLGCSEERYNEFARTLQSSYQKIFIAPGSLAVLTATKDEIRANDSLASSCTKLI